MDIINFKNYSFRYSLEKEKYALKNINFSLEQGEVLALCGLSGSGKSTLLRCLKEEIRPAGISEGSIESSISSENIGIVFQNPDTQLINATVIDNLVFHMENLGYSNVQMKKTLAETATFFGLENNLDMDINSLSGGQKHLIALCTTLMVYPKILLLDEPLSQLDPIASKKFLDTLEYLNKETGITIIIVEHQLDNIIGVADRIGFLEDGNLKIIDNKDAVIKYLWNSEDEVNRNFIPEIPRLCLSIGSDKICYTPREFKENNPTANNEYKVKKEPYTNNDSTPILSIKDLIFFYEGSENFVLKNISLDVYKGDIISVFGSNGCGKSTLLKIIAGILKPYSGKVKKGKIKVGYMPQSLHSYFMNETVLEELKYSSIGEEYLEYIEIFSLENILEKSPFDLSGGEMQKVVLACILSSKPDLIVLDEPTRSLDQKTKNIFGMLLKNKEITAIMTSHDLEFASKFSTKGAMVFNGEVAYIDDISTFFSSNTYYTTTVNKAVGHINKDVFLFEEAVKLWT